MRRAWRLSAFILALASCEPRRPRVGLAPTRPANAAISTPATASRLELSREQGLALLCRTLADRDDDCDRRITVDDERRAPEARWPYVARADGAALEVATLSQAAQLVQELVVELRKPAATFALDVERVRSDPASYLALRIERDFWDALTRRIDADPERLTRAAKDEKLGGELPQTPDFCPTPEKCALRRPPFVTRVAPSRGETRPLHVYYPSADAQARAVFEKAGGDAISVHPLPEKATPAWVLETTRAKRHGLLTLALAPDGTGRPFLVPGGRFNEMYGWDSFFIAWGLVESGRVELARSIVDNQAYEILHYGKILNANRTYYLTRSQPPFFTSAISEVWRRLPDSTENRHWLEAVLGAAIREYRTVWSSAPRRLALCDGDVCLARYFGEGRGEPPEVEPGHFDWFYQEHALAHGHCAAPGTSPESQGRFVSCAEALAERYRSGTLADAGIDEFFANDGCVRESGHDTTFRWFENGNERCAEFATVDLNVLLFKYELDIARLLASAFGDRLASETASAFCDRAAARSRLIEKYLWDEEAGLFFDYDTKQKKRSRYLAATTLYPLWASEPNACGVRLLTPEMAASLKVAALRELEAPGGIFATSKASASRISRPKVKLVGGGALETLVPGRQWEAPNGWAPHQMLAWVGLRRHGFEADAERLAYRWLYTIVKNAASFHGTVPEKFDVALRSHAVFQEYGNVNTEFAYISDEGFGWMNASFVVGWQLLSPAQRESLKRLVPPERLFAQGD